MPAPDKLITTEQMEKALSIDFASKFTETIEPLLALLDIEEPTEVPFGSNIKVYEISGSLTPDTVDEGEELPYSQYEMKAVKTIEATVDNYRKGSSAEAIRKSGFEAAVQKTDRKFFGDIYGSLRKRLIDGIMEGTGTTDAGKNVKAAIAHAIGQLKVDANKANYSEALRTVTFVNPVDIYNYLGDSVEFETTRYGWDIVKNYLGLGLVIADANIPAGEVWSTFIENVNAYTCGVGDINAAGANFYVDATGLIAVAHTYDYARRIADTFVMSSLTLYPEFVNMIVKAEIDPELNVVNIKNVED